jgi:putative toxin-antitoxin system antitoxin component (TIGR02293 family)
MAMRHATQRATRAHTGPSTAAVFPTRGASLGLTANRTDALISQAQRGLPFRSLESLATASNIPAPVLASVAGIAQRTLSRRKATGRFSPDESEKLLRISSVFEKTVELFDGDAAQALAWLTRISPALAHHTPLEYSRSELGAREVETLLGRLQHGIFT